MRVIIAGSRDFDDYGLLKRTLDGLPFEVDEVVSGGARGADSLGERWGEKRKLPITRFPANWELGKRAGPERNEKMAKYGDCLVAFPLGASTGTRDMIKRAKKHGLKVIVVEKEGTPTNQLDLGIGGS